MKRTGPNFNATQLWFAPPIDTLGDSLDEQLKLLERLVEEAILDGRVVVVNCDKLGAEEAATRVIKVLGAVPLRWAAPRLLLLTPEQGRRTDEGEELAREWQLWRYKFDPKTDSRVIGSPNRAEKLLRRNQANGADWGDGLEQRRRSEEVERDQSLEDEPTAQELNELDLETEVSR